MLMKLDINIFQMLNEIAESADITQEEWAKSAGSKQPRISELVKMLSTGEANGRAFTLDKFIKLYKGLEKIMGTDKLQEKFSKKIEKEPDPRKRVLAKVAVVCQDGDDQTIANLENLINLVLKK
jgi:predicted XRE-type DNA-binding protein